MNSEDSVPAGKAPVDPPDFSLVLGGPLYQLFRRAHLSGDALELLRRRILAITLFAWLPLLVLSLAQGNAWGRGVTMPFLFDVDVQVRFLIALPLLVLAELAVHQRVRLVIGKFLERELIPDAERAKFDAALASAMRLRNSVAAEVALLVFVYVVGVMIVWRTFSLVDVASWYGTSVDGHRQPSLAGWWFGLISLPLFQFILLRWYFRLFIWARLLWQISRIDLHLVPTHPDRCGGLGFLANVCVAFAPLLVAQGALLAGTIANQIFFAGAKLTQFWVEIGVVAGVGLIAVVGPLLVFVPILTRVRRIGMGDYGTVAQRYVRAFDQKWVQGGAPPGEALLGSTDIQSLADLSASFDVVRSMKTVPFTKQAVIQLAVYIALPLLPLSLTLISAEELFKHLLKVLF